MKKRPSKCWDLPERSIIAVPLPEGVWAYLRYGRGGEFLYPLCSQGGYFPLHWFSGRNWRWIINAPEGLPKGYVFAGLLPKEMDAWYEGSIRWRIQNLNDFKHVEIYEIKASACETTRLDTYEALKFFFSEVDIPRIWTTENRLDFIVARLPEMTIIDRSMAPLLGSYDTPETEAPTEAIIEVWLAPDLEEPEQTFEDFILDTLMETELGVVGEYADMKDYRFASCDVPDPAKAVKALLKAFKKAGYTTGIEIKERDGKQRVWKLG